MASGSGSALLNRISAVQWDDMVAKLFTADVAEVRPRRWDRLHFGAGIGNQIYRVTGTARLTSGTREWTLVVKIFILDPDTVDPERTRPDGREYWKREWHVYRSEWQQHLDGPLRAARCLGSGEFKESAAQVAWIALEDLSPFDQRPWPMPLFAEVASHIGEFTGAFVNPPAPAIWLSHHWHADLIEGVADCARITAQARWPSPGGPRLPTTRRRESAGDLGASRPAARRAAPPHPGTDPQRLVSAQHLPPTHPTSDPQRGR